MRIHRRRGLTALATIASLASVSVLAAACGSDSDDDSESSGKVTITVEGWRPGDEQGTIDAVNKQAEAFMKDHPDIIVEPIEWEWNAETFATQLAGNQLPTTFRVPFTDTKGLAERQQIADVTAPFVYARIMGTKEAEPKGYSEAGLDRWVRAAQAWAKGGVPEGLEPVGQAAKVEPRDVFLYVISGDKLRNPAAAMDLIARTQG